MKVFYLKKILKGIFSSWFVAGVSLEKNIEELFTNLPIVSGDSIRFC